MKARILTAAVLLASAVPPAAHADAPANYVGLMGSRIFTDNARGTDDGVGWHILYGSPVNRALSLELGAFGQRAPLQAINEYDYAYGLGIDLRYLFGTPRLGTFVLGGLGSVWEDFVNEEELSPYLDFGVGALAGTTRFRVRAEARWYAVFNRDTYAGKSVLHDPRVSLGLQFSFGDGDGAADSDGDSDGVPDSLDGCPATPPGEPVDSRGCPLSLDEDDDGDGVPNEHDECPLTPAGTLVGTVGCPVIAPRPPAPPPADSDGDGVLNAADQCPDTPPGFRVDARGCVEVAQTVVVLENVGFEFGSARLTRDARIVLDAIVRGMKRQPTMQAEIAGHTDAQGTDAYNLQLSIARAASVRNFLVDRGIEPARLKVEGYGEQRPVADNETDDGRARNRRVEFRVIPR